MSTQDCSSHAQGNPLTSGQLLQAGLSRARPVDRPDSDPAESRTMCWFLACLKLPATQISYNPMSSHES